LEAGDSADDFTDNFETTYSNVLAEALLRDDDDDENDIDWDKYYRSSSQVYSTTQEEKVIVPTSNVYPMWSSRFN